MAILVFTAQASCCLRIERRAAEGLTMPTTGEKPGKGTYKCRKCGSTVTLDDDSDTLPPCPSCNGTEFDKIN